MDLSRSLNDSEFAEWSHLMSLLEHVCLGPENDEIKWVYEKSGCFTTRSMYRLMTFRGVVNKRLIKLWNSRLPMKLKVFMWLAVQDRLQTGLSLKKMKWKGCHKCRLCGVPEDVNHIFFGCVVARFVWISFKEALGWEKFPTSLQELLEYWLPLGVSNYSFRLFLSVIIFWVLWKCRNKMVIEGVFLAQPTKIIYKILSAFQRWRVLLKEADRHRMDEQRKMVESWLSSFEAVRGVPDDGPWL